MGFPSEGGEAAYRNVRRFAARCCSEAQPSHAKVPLTSAAHERSAEVLCESPRRQDQGVQPVQRAGLLLRQRVSTCVLHALVLQHWKRSTHTSRPCTDCARFPFDDHNPCPLEMVHEFCASVDQFLLADPAHVVAVHCKAGKGRTGLMVACYLLHAGIAETATEALQIFAQKRTSNGKGVTIPSQIRWVHYYEWLLRNALHRAVPSTTRTLQLIAVRLITVPEFDLTGGCDPYFTVEVTNAGAGLQRTPLFDFRKWQSSLRHYRAKDKVIDMDVARCGVFLRGNAHLEFLDED